MWTNKVVWSEGLFLQPQHFQQHDRHLEYLLDSQLRARHAFGWGFTRLVIDPAALARGQFVLSEGAGLLPDGTPFSFPDVDPPPAALTIEADQRDCLIHLSLPLRRQGIASTSIDPAGRADLFRYVARAVDVADENAGFDQPAPLQVGRMDLRLLPGAVPSGAMASLAVARVVERAADGRVVLDPAHLPALLDVRATPVLSGWLAELLGLVQQRSDVLAQRLTQPGRGGMAEIADFLLLMLANRYLPQLRHLSGLPLLHPQQLYLLCLAMAGELSSFGSDRRLTTEFPAYDHDHLERSFQPVIASLRSALSMVLERTAIQIDLQDRKYGVRVAVIADRQLIDSASFVLAVNAQMPAEAVRMRFPTQVKIGPVEKIRDLVNLQLPGVAIRALPVAPRQVPFHAGFNYFELDVHSELWRQQAASGGLALHVGADFPGLEMELWAIRG